MTGFSRNLTLRLALLLVLTLPLALGGCGRKGPLEPPPQAKVEKKQ